MLTKEQVEILRHTQRNRRFNGTNPDVLALVDGGFMRCIGRPSWVPDDYYVLTDAGVSYLQTHGSAAM